jgi:hypothetical protein
MDAPARLASHAVPKSPIRIHATLARIANDAKE